MRTGEESQNKITDFSAGLNKTYCWFEKNFKTILENSFNEFWGEDADIKLMSISENQTFLAQREEFFVTQIRLNQELSVFVKLSKQLVQNLLENMLGSNGRVFNIEKISELEAKILTGFDNFLFKNFSNYIRKEDELNKMNYNFNECNLVFMLRNANLPIGKIIVKIPVAAIIPESILPPEVPYFDIEDFYNTSVNVRLNTGYSRIKLSDLKSLEKDDIVLLENSKSSRMILKLDNFEMNMKVNPNPAIVIDYDVEDNTINSGGELNMNNNDIHNMWDTIQVEIGAEFEKVKLTLGELKQISEGLVVDIGSVYDNKIELKVEDKIVASGELVIINDRYGVRINEIFAEEKNKAPQSQDIENEEFFDEYEEKDEYQDEMHDDSYEEMPPQADNQNSEVDDEDFDYSDFNVDDEDL